MSNKLLKLFVGGECVGNDFKDLFGPFGWNPDKGGETPPLSGEPENPINRPLNEKEVKVVAVYEAYSTLNGSPVSSQPIEIFVTLRDKSDREIRIFITRDMGLSITLALKNEAPTRPLTHDLIKVLLDRVGVKLERVIIDDIWDDTFYAKLVFSRNNEVIEIDSRSSDAIALALRYRAPIYAAEAVLENSVASEPG